MRQTTARHGARCGHAMRPVFENQLGGAPSPTPCRPAFRSQLRHTTPETPSRAKDPPSAAPRSVAVRPDARTLPRCVRLGAFVRRKFDLSPRRHAGTLLTKSGSGSTPGCCRCACLGTTASGLFLTSRTRRFVRMQISVHPLCDEAIVLMANKNLRGMTALSVLFGQFYCSADA